MHPGQRRMGEPEAPPVVRPQTPVRAELVEDVFADPSAAAAAHYQATFRPRSSDGPSVTALILGLGLILIGAVIAPAFELRYYEEQSAVASLVGRADPAEPSGWRWSTTVFFTGLGLVVISQLIGIRAALEDLLARSR